MDQRLGLHMAINKELKSEQHENTKTNEDDVGDLMAKISQLKII